MSNLNKEIALGLKRGDILYHNIIAFGGLDVSEEDKEAAACKVVGSAKMHPIYGFVLPVKQLYGQKHVTDITEYTQNLWRTTKERPLRVSRVRRAAPVTEEKVTSRPVHRVRRTR